MTWSNKATRMLWIKAFHIISIVCWFAGLFYLPRLFIYHTQTTDSVGNERFKVMERKLYHYITTPAMISSWIFGLLLLYTHAWALYSSNGWLHLKLTLVVLLTVYHFTMGHYVKLFAADKNSRNTKFFRYYNEIPTLFLIIVVILVVVKPF